MSDNEVDTLKVRLAEVEGQRAELASKLSHLVDSLKHAEARALAASRPAPVDREAVARAFVDGAMAVHNEWKQDHEGENKGPPRGDPDFSEAAHDYVSLLHPAEPVEAIQADTVAQRTWFDGENIRTENLTADDIYQKPTPERGDK